MELFGMSVSPTVFWIIVAVIVIALICVIAIPIYQGYKKEMAKTAKKAGTPAKKPAGSSKSSSSKKR